MPAMTPPIRRAVSPSNGDLAALHRVYRVVRGGRHRPQPF